MRLSIYISATLLLFSLTAGCKDVDNGTDCFKNADCGPDGVCLNGSCIADSDSVRPVATDTTVDTGKGEFGDTASPLPTDIDTETASDDSASTPPDIDTETASDDSASTPPDIDTETATHTPADSASTPPDIDTETATHTPADSASMPPDIDTGIASSDAPDTRAVDTDTAPRDSASSVDTETDARSDTGSGPPAGCEGVIAFPDSALDFAVRSVIGKPTENIVYEDLVGLFTFTPNTTAIRDLTGMECLDHLTTLDLAANQPGDLSPLAGLTRLIDLNLYATATTDVSALSGLVNLIRLDIHGNNISDISALSDLTRLTSLSVSFNTVSDISVLANMPDLEHFDIYGNEISSIAPLIANEGISAQDSVDIRDNPLDCNDPETTAHLSQLEERGVDLWYDCDYTPDNPDTDGDTPKDSASGAGPG